LHYMRTE